MTSKLEIGWLAMIMSEMSGLSFFEMMRSDDPEIGWLGMIMSEMSGLSFF